MAETAAIPVSQALTEDSTQQVLYIISSYLMCIEKSLLLKEAEDEYKELLRQLEEDENVTREDIENFKKNALVHKSILEIRRRAQELHEVRSSPERYRKVPSKIQQNIQT